MRGTATAQLVGTDLPMGMGTDSRWRRLAALVLVGAAVAVTGCGTSAPAAAPAPPAAAPVGSAAAADPGFGHVHGLGVDPGDGTLYAAAHYGLWRIPQQGQPGGMERVADRYQDTMGFTVAGPGEFLGSGHPDPGERLPAHLGLIRSRDAGRSWQPVSLLGEADFHALDAEGGRVYGWDATSGTVLVSADGGASWRRGHRGQLSDLVVDPGDPRRLLAADGRGVLSSADGGDIFTRLPSTPALVTVDWSREALVGADRDGVVWASGDAGATWVRRGSVQGPTHALTVAGDGAVYAADAAGVAVSRDGGATFTRLVTYRRIGAGQ